MVVEGDVANAAVVGTSVDDATIVVPAAYSMSSGATPPAPWWPTSWPWPGPATWGWP